MERSEIFGQGAPSEFKADAVAMVLNEGNSIADVAKRLGIGESSLGNRARQEGVDRGDRAALTTSERVELAELRAEAKRRRMERELLKRATALAGRLRC